jgi:hypothetical protein
VGDRPTEKQLEQIKIRSTREETGTQQERRKTDEETGGGGQERHC